METGDNSPLCCRHHEMSLRSGGGCGYGVVCIGVSSSSSARKGNSPPRSTAGSSLGFLGQQLRAFAILSPPRLPNWQCHSPIYFITREGIRDNAWSHDCILKRATSNSPLQPTPILGHVGCDTSRRDEHPASSRPRVF